MDLIAQVISLTYNIPGWQRITTPYLKARAASRWHHFRFRDDWLVGLTILESSQR